MSTRFFWFRQSSNSQRTSRRRTPSSIGLRFRLESLEDRFMMSGDPVLHWNEVAVEATFSPENNPTVPPFFRDLAIVYTAMYDAVNAIDGSYAPYFADVQAPPDASMEAAAAQAAHDALSALYPDKQAIFDAALAEDLVGIPQQQAEQGSAVGAEVARQILELRSNDGSDMPVTYSLPEDPGNWQPTGAPAVLVHAGSITPFADRLERPVSSSCSAGPDKSRVRRGFQRNQNAGPSGQYRTYRGASQCGHGVDASQFDRTGMVC